MGNKPTCIDGGMFGGSLPLAFLLKKAPGRRYCAARGFSRLAGRFPNLFCKFFNRRNGCIHLFDGIEPPKAKAYRALGFRAQGLVHARGAVGPGPSADAIGLGQFVGHRRRNHNPGCSGPRWRPGPL